MDKDLDTIVMVDEKGNLLDITSDEEYDELDEVIEDFQNEKEN